MAKVSQTELIAGAISGKAVSFPTDTVPALAIKPEYGDLIYQIKKRAKDKPLILMGASVDDLLPYIKYTAAELVIWKKLISQYLPGALTLVLPASDLVPPAINPTSSNTVGIRIPDNSTARKILQHTGVLATTSANISGEATLTSMDAISDTFAEVLVLAETESNRQDFIGSGLPSTVICWQNKQWQILRQGSIKINEN
ncbi:MAG: L-threonylcarbamoyladenylate synthase [Cyanobacteria bacterium P01_G01_bin.19]